MKKFDKYDRLFAEVPKNGKSIKITDRKYYMLTGKHIPSSMWYLKNKSSLFNAANSKDIKIVDAVDRYIVLKKG